MKRFIYTTIAAAVFGAAGMYGCLQEKDSYRVYPLIRWEEGKHERTWIYDTDKDGEVDAFYRVRYSRNGGPEESVLASQRDSGLTELIVPMHIDRLMTDEELDMYQKELDDILERE